MTNLPVAGGSTAEYVPNYGRKDAADRLFQDAIAAMHQKIFTRKDWAERWRKLPDARWLQFTDALQRGGVQRARAEMPPETDLEAFKAWRLKWGNEFYKRLMREAVG